MEQPVLRLGLLGFETGHFQRLRDWAERPTPGWPQWQVGDPHQADAWLIDGQAVDVLGRDALLIHQRQDGTRLSLHRADVDRPLAFAEPLPEGFASAEAFDAADEQSLRQRLQRFEAWLRPLRTQFALGGQLVERMNSFRNDVVHLMHDGQLLAVVDFPGWMCGLKVPARPVDLTNAQWVRRPGRANDIPGAFLKLGIQRVMWNYAVRTRRDILPERYRLQRIHLRRVPRLPPRWFEPLHLRLMETLSMTPSTLEELQETLGEGTEVLASHLAALFYAGGLTTDPESAQRAQSKVRQGILSLRFGDGRQRQESHGPSTGLSDQMAPSSLLRGVVATPLRPVTDDVDTVAPPSGSC